ncbi:MAG TPA: ABC transporter permease [Solirubrobacteraceae bacterium]|jgi:putative spermidine/putrescine transport system permease protein|nr:ABC transporter permease [Solirubrobacteraceae bacterium]
MTTAPGQLGHASRRPGGAVASRVRGALGGSGAWWLLLPPAGFLVLLLAVPLGFLLYEALNDAGFSTAASDAIFRESAVRTIIMATVVAALTLILGTLYALALAVSPRWVAVLLLISLFTLFWTSLLVRTYGWMLLVLPQGPIYSVLHGLGLRDQPLDIFQTTFAAYPAMVHVMMPYVVLPVYAAIRQLDPTQLRAARVLGARPLLTMRKVVLPQLKSGIMAGAILVWILSLGFYVTPQLLGSPTAPTVAGMIGATFIAPDETAQGAAMSLMLLTVVIVVYVAADRAFKVSEQWGRG